MPEFEVTKAIINGINCLIPVGDTGNNFLAKKMHEGDILPAKVWKPRNYGYHRKYMAMLKYLEQNCDKYNCIEAYKQELKLRTGYYTIHTTSKGVEVPILKSISFAEMDQVEFEEFFSKCIDAILMWFIPGEKEKMIDDILNFC